ncbi:hypothetical protein AO716_09570 [Arthrobacter sp. Edens01]|nr:hypothetical protein AO716_09570 [Arthrobacter sp. Edens01]
MGVAGTPVLRRILDPQDHESQREALAGWAATLSRSGVPQMTIRSTGKTAGGKYGAPFSGASFA